MLKSRLKSVGLTACLVSAVLGGGACRQDMHDNPKFKAYRDGANRELPEGTVARGSLDLSPAAPKISISAGNANNATQPAGIPTAAAAAGGNTTGGASTGRAIPKGEDGFPFKITTEILERGENRFNISCSPCHGKLGNADGMVVLRGFRKPPEYTQERLIAAPSSYFYDIITNGFGAMPSYADQLTPEDRWKVIAWIRVLQLSQHAKESELPENLRKELENPVKETQEKH